CARRGRALAQGDPGRRDQSRITASACGGKNAAIREAVNLPKADHIFEYRIAATANSGLARNDLVRKELPQWKAGLMPRLGVGVPPCGFCCWYLSSACCGCRSIISRSRRC